jgi:hypothetical protein
MCFYRDKQMRRVGDDIWQNRFEVGYGIIFNIVHGSATILAESDDDVFLEDSAAIKPDEFSCI